MQVNSASRYESGDRSITDVQFFAPSRDGQRCEVKGHLVGTVLTATKVELDDDNGD